MSHPGRWVRAVTALAVAVIACAADRAEKGPDAMMGTLVKVIPESQVVALVKLGSSHSPTTVSGDTYERFAAEVLEAFKNQGRDARSISILLSAESVIELGDGDHEAVVFLQPEGSSYRLTMYSEPVEVPRREREAFLDAIRGWVRVTQAGAAPTALREHVVRMLQSGMEFFQDDASRAALDLSGFSDADVDGMIQLVEGNGQPPLKDLTRDNVIATIFRCGARERVTEFGRELLLQRAHREIYLGLADRDPADVEAITRAFLDDRRETVQVGGLLIAGLLRRADWIDAFERSLRGSPSPELASAIAQARAFVKREL